MSRFSKLLSLFAAIVAVAAAPNLTIPTLNAGVEPPFAGVSLKIGNETVEPGGIAQVKLFVTEPKPISTARNRLSLGGFSSFEGIALMSTAGDTLGVAVVRG